MLEISKLTQALADLKDDEVLDIINHFIDNSPNKEGADKLIKAAQEGMAIVGDRFERGDYFVGDLIFAGEIMADVIDLIKPIICGESKGNITGKIVLGTVKGDLHDIGKNIFKVMAIAEGFEVHDIGIDQPVEAFIEKVKEVKPDILGMSGVLSLALNVMKNTVDTLVQIGLRDDLKIIIGGNPVSKDACEHINADAFTTNAIEGLAICKEWVKK